MQPLFHAIFNNMRCYLYRKAGIPKPIYTHTKFSTLFKSYITFLVRMFLDFNRQYLLGTKFSIVVAVVRTYLGR